MSNTCPWKSVWNAIPPEPEASPAYRWTSLVTGALNRKLVQMDALFTQDVDNCNETIKTLHVFKNVFFIKLDTETRCMQFEKLGTK